MAQLLEIRPVAVEGYVRQYWAVFRDGRAITNAMTRKNADKQLASALRREIRESSIQPKGN